MVFKRSLATTSTFLLIAALATTPAQALSAKKTVRGPAGQTLTISATTVKDGQVVNVTGNRFNKKVGIYLAFCVVNKKGVAPGPCGGSINTTGASSSSIWISSNPPDYGKSVAIPFSRTGGFKQKITVTRYIGDIDCAVAKCAIVTRADHTAADNRKADVIATVRFRK